MGGKGINPLFVLLFLAIAMPLIILGTAMEIMAAVIDFLFEKLFSGLLWLFDGAGWCLAKLTTRR